jgi:hypothetical protein
MDARLGGSIEMMPAEPPALPQMKRMTGRILAWDPPRVLEHEAGVTRSLLVFLLAAQEALHLGGEFVA